MAADEDQPELFVEPEQLGYVTETIRVLSKHGQGSSLLSPREFGFLCQKTRLRDFENG
jgi:hypothetical protein